jgi:hypothetical protein
VDEYTRYGMIGNTTIKRKMEYLVEKMLESCLIKRFRYVWRRCVEPPTRRVYQINDSPIDRSRGRP